MEGRVTNIFTNYKLEPYVVSKLSKHERSVFAQFWCGTQSNLIETGRFRNERICDHLCILFRAVY